MSLKDKLCTFHTTSFSDPNMDTAEKISLLQSNMEELRRTYTTVKNQLAVLDRRRKKISRKAPRGNQDSDKSISDRYGISGPGGSGGSGGAVEAAA